jgi:tripartite ATP-independent transporter DctM subunit
MVGLIIVLMLVGFPVAFAFLGANVVGAWLFMGGSVGLDQLVANGASSVHSFLLVAIPLFIVMGELFFHSGLSQRAFDALDKLFHSVPGRISYMTVAAGTLFATLSGSSLASGAMLGSVVLPEAARRGYKKYIAIGPILGAGGLAILIPPSALMVLLGSTARIDIGALLLAGVIPGLVLAALYVVTIYIIVRIDPAAAPVYVTAPVPFADKLRIIAVELVPLAVVLFSVVGTIVLGIATPSESAAFGVVAILGLTLAYRCFSWRLMVKAFDAALRVSVMIFIIIVGSSTFSQILAFSGATGGLIEWVTGFELDRYTMLAAMFALLLLLGMLLDAISIMLLTIPIFMPLVQHFGFEPVLFGVIMMVSLEIGAITPPFGLLLFVIQGVTRGEASLKEVFLASLPFLGCALLLVLLLVVFPEIALYLPRIAG